MTDGYCALAISICMGVLPELAWARLAGGTVKGSEFAADIACMREAGLFWSDIGEMIGTGSSGAYRVGKMGGVKRGSV